MPFVITGDAAGSESIKQVGGKAAHLGDMIRAGFPVPEAFFVTVESWNKFMADNELNEKIAAVLSRTKIDNVDSLDKGAEEIRKIVMGGKMPPAVREPIVRAYRTLSHSKNNVISMLLGSAKTAVTPPADFVALRSSAISEDIAGASSAGQYESFLNVRGDENVVLNVQKCWASFFLPRAIYYRNKNNQSQTAGMGVIVQRMINSEKSGVTFTVDPTDPKEGANRIVTEAVWGLGETIVQGLVEPDYYEVDKTSGKILEKKTGKKVTMRIRNLKTGLNEELPVKAEDIERQVLTDTEIVMIAAYSKNIEKSYDGQPQDIEWAVEKGKIYILQTRAVTVLEKKEGREVTGREELIRGSGVSPGTGAGPVKIIKDMSELDKIVQGDVLVTEMTSPDYVPAMEKSSAIITDKGGSTCHAAIVSRELGIPCIVGTERATQILKDGQLITVDATKGIVYAGADEAAAQTAQVSTEERKTAVQVKCNLAFPHMAQKAVRADGVGLLRLEHMLTVGGTHPIEYVRQGRPQELTRIIVDGVSQVAEAFKGKPVWVRTLDARTDEFRSMKGGENEPHEDNPMLGWHGIRRDLDEPELFRAQIQAFKQLHEKGHTNVAIMLPFIINVEELRKARKLAREFGLPDSCKFGIMVETPAAALNAEEFCKEGIDFISFGSNDLTQLTLGLDRNNERLIKLFDEMHPSMQFQFKHAISACKRYGVTSSICGELPSNREDAVKFLIGAGISSVSVNIDAIEKVRGWVASIEGA
jgi:pyruvate,water dikinase